MEGGRFKLGFAPWDQMILITMKRVHDEHLFRIEVVEFLVWRNIKHVSAQFIKRCIGNEICRGSLHSHYLAKDHF